MTGDSMLDELMQRINKMILKDLIHRLDDLERRMDDLEEKVESLEDKIEHVRDDMMEEIRSSLGVGNDE